MIEHSFLHLPGIGPAKEQKLWNAGITRWDELRIVACEVVSAAKRAEFEAALDLSCEAWDEQNFSYFAQNLPKSDMWRMIPGREQNIAYVDIETTGLHRPPEGYSTTITFLFRGEVLQEYEFAKKQQLIHYILSESEIVCTFNGASFDIPWMQREFNCVFTQPHVDLRVWMCKQGFKGGLKSIQKLMTDIPQRTGMDITGYDAVKLWKMHLQGVAGALETLLTYNAEDTLVLHPLLVKAFNKEVETHPQFQLNLLKMPILPKLKTDICPNVYSLLGYSE